MSTRFSRLIALALLVTVLATLAGAAGAAGAAGPTWTPGADPAATEKAAVRFRNFAPNFTGFDVRVGAANFPAPQYAEYDSGAAFPWGASNPVTFSYDSVNKVTATFPTIAGSGTGSITYATGSLAPISYLKVSISCRHVGTMIKLTSVTLNGVPLPDVVPPSCGGLGDLYSWYLTGVDLDLDTPPFALAANLELSGFASGMTTQDYGKVDIAVGSGPEARFTPFDKLMVCNSAELAIDLTNLRPFYGYQFEVTYNDALLDATGSFVNTWFDTMANAHVPGGWGAACANGVCKFAVSKMSPAGPVSGTGPIGKINFVAQAAGVSTVQMVDLVVTDIDGFAITTLMPSPVELTTCGRASFSGKVSLQGRLTPMDAGEVKAIDASGTFPPITVPFDANGNFSLPHIPVLPGGSNYKIQATHILYVGNQKALTLNPGANLVNQNTRLFGGDADNGGLNPPREIGVDILDLSCVAGSFDGPPAPCGAFANSNTDINKDNVTNIQDLALTGGNYGKNPFQGW